MSMGGGYQSHWIDDTLVPMGFAQAAFCASTTLQVDYVVLYCFVRPSKID